MTLRGVLAAVNRIRVKHGAEPLEQMPKGDRRAANSCPLAMAFRDMGVTFIWTAAISQGDGVMFETPPLLFEFARRFDAGEFPELER